MPDSRARRLGVLHAALAFAALGGAGFAAFSGFPPSPAVGAPVRGVAFRPNPRPLPPSLGPVAVSGTINGAAQSVTCPVGDQGTVTCQITGTWSASLTFEATVDNLTWATARANAIASDTLVTAPAANGLYVLSGNFTAVRVRDTAYTSGAVVITMRATPSSSANIPVSSVGGSGGGGGGGAATIADGADVTQGALADAAVGDATGSVNSHLRQIAKTLATAVPVTGTFFQATQPISGTVTANAGTGTFTAAGNLTHNNAAPGIANFGALVALASTAAPSWTDGFQTLLSQDLSGHLRTINTPSGTQTISGTITANAGTGPFPVGGQAAAAAAISGNPVSMGGRDASGNSQFIGGNNSGIFAQGPVAAGSAVAGNPLLLGVSDGANVQTIKQGTVSTGLAVTGFPGVQLFASNGTTLDPVKNDGGGANASLRVNLASGGSVASVSGISTDGNVTAGVKTFSVGMDWNGASADLHRNNVINNINTAAITTTANSATQTNFSNSGVIITLNISAASGTTPTLDIKVQIADGAGTFFDLTDSTGAAVAFAQKTTTGTDTLKIMPGCVEKLTTTGKQYNGQLPRSYRLAYTVGGTTPSFTARIDALELK